MDVLVAQWRPFATEQAQTEGVALGAAVVLLLLDLIFLPRAPRKRLVTPALLLAAHVLALGVQHAFEEGSQAREAAWLVGLFLILACDGVVLFHFVTGVLLRRYLERFSKILLDVILGLIYGLALLVTLRAAGVELSSLLTGSAVLTAVIGLSMRDTLGNLFAGLSLQAQRPFTVGDWIQFDPQPANVGQVIEINWRATTVLTLDDAEITIPNSALAAANIVNFTRPHRWTRRSVFVTAPSEAPPQHVQQIILDAIVGAWGVMDHPPPSVVTQDFDANGMRYWVRFFTSEFGKRDAVEGGVRDRIWYALHRHGIALPVNQHVVHLHQPDPAVAEEGRLAARLAAMHCVDFFDALPEEALRRLAEAARSRLYAGGETIIRQGDQGEELFVIVRGGVAVTMEEPGKLGMELARMGPNAFFGEMSLLTGEPRSATVRATKESELLVVDRAAFRQVLEASPELAQRVGETIVARHANRASRRGVVPEEAPAREEGIRRLVKRIREFFAV